MAGTVAEDIKLPNILQSPQKFLRSESGDILSAAAVNNTSTQRNKRNKPINSHSDHHEKINNIISPAISSYNTPTVLKHDRLERGRKSHQVLTPRSTIGASLPGFMSPDAEHSLVSVFSEFSLDSLASLDHSTTKTKYLGVKYGDCKADPTNQVFKVLAKIGKAMKESGQYQIYDISGQRVKEEFVGMVALRERMNTLYNIQLTNKEIDLIAKKFNAVTFGGVDIVTVLASAKAVYDKKFNKLQYIKMKEKELTQKELQQQELIKSKEKLKNDQINKLREFKKKIGAVAYKIALTPSKFSGIFHNVRSTYSPREFIALVRAIDLNLTTWEEKILLRAYSQATADPSAGPGAVAGSVAGAGVVHGHVNAIKFKDDLFQWGRKIKQDASYANFDGLENIDIFSVLDLSDDQQPKNLKGKTSITATASDAKLGKSSQITSKKNQRNHVSLKSSALSAFVSSGGALPHQNIYMSLDEGEEWLHMQQSFDDFSTNAGANSESMATIHLDSSLSRAPQISTSEAFHKDLGVSLEEHSFNTFGDDIKGPSRRLDISTDKMLEDSIPQSDGSRPVSVACASPINSSIALMKKSTPPTDINFSLWTDEEFDPGVDAGVDAEVEVPHREDDH